MSVVILTTGVPGCGKTYVRAARFLVDDFLVNTNGIHISNFPLNISVISEDVSRKINKNRGIFGIFRKPVSPEDIAKRIEIIPDEVLQSWRSGLSGPWDYFEGRNLKYCHIALDEIHNFINYRISEACLKEWDDWLGEVRHRGCTFEGLTQDVGQVDSVLTGRASVRLELVPAEDLRDPYFKIRMMDWYELKAGFTGSFHKTVFMLEKRRSDGRWKTNHTSRFLITPEYFKYYNSFSASLQEKEKGSVDDNRATLYEYQKRTRLSLLLWFVRRNWISLLLRISLAIFLIWLCFGGGLLFFMNRFMSGSSFIARANSKKLTSEKKVDDPVNVNTYKKESFNRPSKENQTSKNSLEFQKYLDEKEKKKNDEVKPVLFFDGKCYLGDGTCIFVGYVFNSDSSSLCAGKEVKSINSAGRFYMLDDGTFITMY